MTINEAINHAKEQREIFSGTHGEFLDFVVEKLEELENYKLGNCMNDCEHYDNCSNYIHSKGYNQGIENFVKEIKKEYDNDACPNVSDCLDYQISIRDLVKISEELINNLN